MKEMSNDLYQTNEVYTMHIGNNRQEWLDKRIKGIGGSDISAVIGVNSWKNNQELFREKVGGVKDYKEPTKAMRYGTLAEKHIRELFVLDNEGKYQVQYMENAIAQNNEYPFMLYSPDGLIIDLENNQKGVLEIKTTETVKTNDKEKWKEQIPQNYYTQCLQGLIVLGFDFVILVAELKNYEHETNTPYFVRKIYKIEKVNVLEDLQYIKEKEIEFWGNVVAKKEPTLLLTL